MHQALMAMLLSYGITRRYDSSDEGTAAALDDLAAAKKAADAEAAEKQAAAATELAAVKADNARLKTENETLKTAKADADDRADHADLAPLATALGLDPAATPKGRDLRKAIAQARLGERYKADASDAQVDAVIELVRADHADGQADGKGTGRDAGARAWESPAHADGASPAGTSAASGKPRGRTHRWGSQHHARGE